MNNNKIAILGGLLLIGAGLLALAQEFGYLGIFSPLAWALLFAGIGLIGLVGYALSGWTQWGLLSPTGIFGGLAVTVFLATSGLDGAGVAAPLFIGLLVPFAAAFLTDRSRNWWALIPGGVMLFLTLVLLTVDTIGGEWIGALLLFMLAIAFLTVYLTNRNRSWALIAAYTLAVVGVAPLMALGGNDAAYFGPFILFAASLAFLVVYLRSAIRWWAILPAGALTVVATIALLAISGRIQSQQDGAYIGALLMGGLAATFAVIWLRHAKTWAQIVTFVLAALAVTALFFASYYQFIWPVAVIVLGAYLLFTALRPKAVH
jgi:hypothetical protein